MKKIICLFSVSLLMFSSCSSDDNSPGPVSVPLILPQTLTYTFLENSNFNDGATIIYNGNKMVSFVRDNARSDFTYDGNVIVKIISYNTESGQDVKISEQTYTYANSKVATRKVLNKFTPQFPMGYFKSKFVFTYNSDGTVLQEEYNTDPTTGIESKNNQTTMSTFANGNLVKSVYSNELTTTNKEFEYDSKNNPYKNILGYNIIFYTNPSIGSVNNIIKQTTTHSSQGVMVFDMENVYDANEYLTKTAIYYNGTIFEMYEYNY